MAHTRKHPAPTGDSWRQHRCMGWHKGVASQDTPQEIQVRNTDDYPCTNGNGHIHSPQVFNVGWCGDPIPKTCLELGSVTLQGIWSHTKSAEFAKFFTIILCVLRTRQLCSSSVSVIGQRTAFYRWLKANNFVSFASFA